MKVDFVRFKATDSVELQGWLNIGSSDTAVLHIHGMSGNGYENYFLDKLRQSYSKNNISLFAIDTRGRGVISSFGHGGDLDAWGLGTKLGGSCFEIFQESAHDIQGAIDYLKSIGKSKIILQGHSLGCTKAVNFVINDNADQIQQLILLAPTDMVGWASTDKNHTEYLERAKQLVATGNGEELVSTKCWLDKTPISAQTYPTICEAGSAADIYGNEGEALLSKVNIPTLILYGDADIGIKEIDGTIDSWLERTNKIKNKNTIMSIIEGAPHSFRNFEDRISDELNSFVNVEQK